jgi:small subunit ribosomal protein S14
LIKKEIIQYFVSKKKQYSMLHKNNQDEKKRSLFNKYEAQRALLKFLFYNASLDKSIRFEAGKKLAGLPRNSSMTRIQRRCVFSARSRGVLRKFQLSRLKFRQLALQGLLPGVVKASW